jgi:hypothetical protein
MNFEIVQRNVCLRTLHTFLCKILKFKNFFINIKPNVPKLWIFTSLNMVFPVVVLVFDFNESSERGVTWPFLL